MKKAIQIFAIGYLICLIGCKQNQSSNPISHVTKADSVVTMIPDSVFIGSKFKISVVIHDSVYRVDNVIISDSCLVGPDSILSPYSYFTVPFLAKSGTLTALSQYNEIGRKHVTVIESYSTSIMNVGWYNLAAPIALKDTCYYDSGNNLCIWNSAVNGDTIRLTLNYSDKFTLYMRELTFVDQGANQLPKFVRYIFTRIDDTSTKYIDTVSTGVIKILQWNKNDGIFGQLFSSLHNSGARHSQEAFYFTFYYNYK